MRLYHFTGRHHLAGIRRDGIALGGFPVVNAVGETVKVLRGYQWLTDDPEWTNQAWTYYRLLRDQSGGLCDRTEYRVEVVIPKAHRRNVTRFDQVAGKLPAAVRTGWEQTQGFTEGSEHWWIYVGRIPPGWIRQVVARPEHLTVEGRP